MEEIRDEKQKNIIIIAAAIAIAGFGSLYATSGIVPDMTFVGDAVSLSVEDATAKMLTDSPGARIAAINLKTAEATALGYSESASSITDMLNAYEAAGILTTAISTSDKDLLKLQRDFARTQGPMNFEAQINTLKIDTIKNYFMLLQAADAVKINQENLAVQERIYTNTKKKFELGVVSKQDVLQAEIAVMTAKDSLSEVENGLKMAKMGLNSFLGYDVMQNLVLTDSLKAIEISKIPLSEAIEKALSTRNEIKAASFGLLIQKSLLMKVEVRYPKSSATYLKQSAAVLNAENMLNQSLSGIEIDVRSKYMTMLQKKAAIETGIASATKAKELFRLAELSYSVGMNTIADVQQVQIMALGEQLALSRTILDYNLSVYAYNISATAGTFKAPL